MHRTGLPAAGLAWLFMGVANSDAKLYDDELQEILATYPDQVSRRLLLTIQSICGRAIRESCM